MNERELFLAALDIDDPERRAQFLAEQCGNDSDRLKRLQQLLQAKSAAQSFLESPANLGEDALTGAYVEPKEMAGALIAGKYTLVEIIGEGGMGSVWRAKQTEPVKRFVAVKLIKVGMDSKKVLARFEAERQALALMDHPNIAKVFDGGIHDGRPYFVMELVKGTPITEYCDARKLTPKDRLDLFVQACQAIQHAHQKGIIHRDIKPTNVLVALYDDRPVVKVIDFGVAKATGGTLTEQTIDTGLGAVVGTPQYMSPEQATFNNLDIDTRSDVYALGVLLYELLTGSTPFSSAELKKRGLMEILRVVREEEPPRPSNKLSTADTLPNISANRGTEPKKLTGLLRNELDWIVMKALEKDRTRRYETANGFAADVLRYLAGEPVQAHPPSRGYRLQKFVRRNRGQVIAASAIVLALLFGIVGTSLGLMEARRQTARARDESAAKEQARAEEARQRALADENRAKAVAAREDEARQRRVADAEKQKAIEFRNKALDALRAATSDDVEKLLGEKKELTANERAYVEAIAKRWQEFANQEGTDEQSRAIRAEGQYRVATLWLKLGRRDEAQAGYERSTALGEILTADFPTVPDYRRCLAGGHTGLGILLRDMGQRTKAEQRYRKGMALLEKLMVDLPAVPMYRDDLSGSCNDLGLLLGDLGKWKDAEVQYRRSLDLLEKLAADFPEKPSYLHDQGGTLNNLGDALSAQNERAEAEKQYRKALSILKKAVTEFPGLPTYRRNLSVSHDNLASLLSDQGRSSESEEHYRQALALRERLVADFPSVPDYRFTLGGCYCNFGTLLREGGQPAESLPWYTKAIATLGSVREADRRDVAARQFLKNSHWGRAEAYDAVGQHAEAVKDWDKAVELSPRQQVRMMRVSRAMSRVKAGMVSEAVADATELVKVAGVPASVMYELARVFSVASCKIDDKKTEYAERAMETLLKAVKAGYNDVAHFKQDTDLDPLRRREDFKKLLAELEAKPLPKPAK